MDPKYGYWVVGLIKIITMTTTFFFIDAYESFRLKRLSLKKIEFILKLFLRPFSGS